MKAEALRDAHGATGANEVDGASRGSGGDMTDGRNWWSRTVFFWLGFQEPDPALENFWDRWDQEPVLLDWQFWPRRRLRGVGSAMARRWPMARKSTSWTVVFWLGFQEPNSALENFLERWDPEPVLLDWRFWQSRRLRRVGSAMVGIERSLFHALQGCGLSTSVDSSLKFLVCGRTQALGLRSATPAQVGFAPLRGTFLV